MPPKRSGRSRQHYYVSQSVKRGDKWVPTGGPCGRIGCGRPAGDPIHIQPLPHDIGYGKAASG